MFYFVHTIFSLLTKIKNLNIDKQNVNFWNNNEYNKTCNIYLLYVLLI